MYSERQRAILAAIYHQANVPLNTIARQLGLREHTVRREVTRFIEDHVARKLAFIDSYRLGYVQYEICLSLGAERTVSTKTFLQFLQESPRVAWIGQFSGAFQYIITVCVRNPYELRDFINQLSERSGIALTRREISVRLAYTEFPLRYLSRPKREHPVLHFGVPGNVRIDTLDHEILRHLSGPESLSKAQLAKNLRVPLSTCLQRMQRLEKLGIIAGYTYVIDFSKLGVQAYTLLLATKSHSNSITQRLFAFCAAHPSVAFITENIGAFDYKIGVHLFNPADILSVQQRLASDLADELVSCTSLTAYDYLKVARYPFVTPPDQEA